MRLPPKRRPEVLHGVTVGWVTDDDVAALSAAVHQLEVDATVAVAESLPGGSAARVFGLTQVAQSASALANEWDAWVADNTGLVARATGDGDLARFQTRYAEVRSSLVHFGGQTDAPDLGAPGGGGALGDLLWVAVPVGLAAVAIAYVGPTLVAGLLAPSRSRA